jgi:UDP-glucose:(heptosyl)LPS alpha-1,3-glucosyltransferase
MKTAVVCPNLYRRGGIERVAIEAIRGLEKCGHQLTVAASYVEEGVVSDHVTVVDVPRPRFGSSGNVALFGRACKQKLQASGTPQAVLGFGATSPDDAVVWVGSVHARWLATAKHAKFRGQFKRLLNPFHRVAIYREKQLFGSRRYRRLLALTTDLADDLIHFYKVPASDIDIVPNGVCQKEFKPAITSDRLEMRARFGIQTDDKAICFVANESDRKGLPQLIEVLAKINDPKLKLLVAGRVGPAVDRLSNEFKVKDRVTWVGQLEDIAPIFQASDLFVLPTAYEAWGLVIVEALSCGTPVITTRLAGASEAVRHEDNGFLLNRADDLIELKTHIERSFEKNGWDHQAVAASVQSYTWDGIIPRVAEILEATYTTRPWAATDRSLSGSATA